MKLPVQKLDKALTARVMAIRDSQRRLRRHDAAALHDLRVAVRRLRASLAPWRGYPSFHALHQPLQALAAAMSDSGARRDHEVQRQWLLRLVSRPDARLLAWWQSPPPSDGSDAISPRVLRPLVRQLTRELPRAWHRALQHEGDAVLRQAQEALARRLLFRIQSALGDEAQLVQLPEPLHALRLNGKRLRYLLEPAAAPAVQVLRHAQHALGDWRDVDSLQRLLDQEGLLSGAAARQIRAAHTELLQVAVNALQDLDKLTEADLS